ncbi:hypothetical protein D0Z70_08240 [Sphingobium terrigena]|uniref:Uncharacterized protein n=1 Tax=Sphingobium terrigena TaxID=2304063 RepID=A0A418YTK7_9SPHN|nr:hypothetical protein [Sphingobium terrigena]RJG55389.1 hypothetical protein D0Z70_08240 [Sphingobium terrigena]
MSKIGHFEIAVLMKVNELAQRHGLELWEFDAEYDTETGELSFPSTPGGADRYERFRKMKDALGCGEGGKLQLDSDAALLEALDTALSTAPRPRLR